MSKPEHWKQEGPLGDDAWSIAFGVRGFSETLVADVSIGRATNAWVAAPAAQHLRDFARALDRAAAALEAAAVPAPDPWPPEGCKIGNPDWPAGDGPHLVRKDD
jgi:hypothetical protein